MGTTSTRPAAGTGAASAHPARRRRRWPRNCARSRRVDRRDRRFAQPIGAAAQTHGLRRAAAEDSSVLQSIMSITAGGRSGRQPLGLRARPDQRAVGALTGNHAVQRRSQRGLFKAPRIGKPASLSRTGTCSAMISGTEAPSCACSGAISVMLQLWPARAGCGTRAASSRRGPARAAGCRSRAGSAGGPPRGCSSRDRIPWTPDDPRTREDTR